jgi:predicted PurR-regulated permease PerM
MVISAQKPGFSVGATLLHDDVHPLEVDASERRKLLAAARAMASLVCVVLVVGVAGLLIYFVVPQLIQTIIELVNTLPQRLTALARWLEVHVTHIPSLSKWVNNVANVGTTDIINWVREHILDGNAMNIATMISSGVTTAVKYVLNAFIGLLIMAYLLNYKERLFAITRKMVNATFSQKRKATLYEFAGIVNETFIGFIVGRIIDSFIIGVLTYIVLKICAIPFALMLSVIVGVTNIIPFFGPFIGAIPSVFILLLENPIEALYFIIIIIVIQQLDGNVIGPKIVGNALGIGSFWVLVSVLIGGGLFGFPGMALGVPVFAVFYRYADKLMTNSLKRREKNTHTSYYYSLEPYGLEDDEVELEPDRKQQQSWFSRFRKEKKDLSQNKFAFDHIDGDQNRIGEVKDKNKDLLE